MFSSPGALSFFSLQIVNSTSDFKICDDSGGVVAYGQQDGTTVVIYHFQSYNPGQYFHYPLTGISCSFARAIFHCSFQALVALLSFDQQTFSVLVNVNFHFPLNDFAYLLADPLFSADNTSLTAPWSLLLSIILFFCLPVTWITITVSIVVVDSQCLHSSLLNNSNPMFNSSWYLASCNYMQIWLPGLHHKFRCYLS